jgi:hypothetical protein
MNWPTRAVIALDGENIDGENNALLATGYDAYSWVNSGSFSTPFTRTTVPATPLMKKLPGASVVSFDGRDDQLSCVGSAAALAFIHTTGVFDIALVLRRMATRSTSAVRVFGTEGKGLGVYSTGYVANTTIEGGYQFFLSNGSQSLSTLATQKIRAPIGEVSCLFLRGDGASLRATQDFWDWETQDFLAAVDTGSAAFDYAIGCTGGNPGSADDFSCMDVLDFRVWNRNLSKAETDLVQANFTTRSACP